MATHASEGGDIDTETLQSQIDLSMSLVHNLVSSWMKPSQQVGAMSSDSAQKELEEYMRRPPRLGVGAPIPETSTASRDTARLKTQLTKGKKRARDEDGDIKKQSWSSDDEKESRAAVMQKKVRIDPFGGEKNRKNHVNGLFTPQHTPGSSQAQLSQDIDDEVSEEGDIDIAGTGPPASPVQLTTSPRKKKKKRRKALNVDSGAVKLSSPPLTPGQDTQGAASIARDRIALPSGSVGPPRTPVRSVLIPNRPTSVTSTHAASMPVRVHAPQDSAAMLKLPLLNLDGPPPDVSDSEADNNPSPSESPKKKRKRRKKKKQSLSNTPQGIGG